MDETFHWFSKADLSKYEDKYVSIVGKEVVFADEDPGVAYTKAKEKYPDKEVVFWKVPHGETFIFSKRHFDITFQQRNKKTIFVWQR